MLASLLYASIFRNRSREFMQLLFAPFISSVPFPTFSHTINTYYDRGPEVITSKVMRNVLIR